MLKPKKGLKRKELKEDKFVKTTLQIKTYIDENYTQVLTYTGGILAAVALIIIFSWYFKSGKEKAAAILGVAQIEYANMNYEKAIQKLDVLIDEHGGTDEADQGLFLLANIRYQREQYQEAKETYEEFLDSYSGSNILRASAMSGIAACLEMENEFLSAAQKYKEAARIAGDFVQANQYRHLAGLCFKRGGDVASAREQFEYIVNNSKTNEQVDEAKQQLILLQNQDS